MIVTLIPNSQYVNATQTMSFSTTLLSQACKSLEKDLVPKISPAVTALNQIGQDYTYCDSYAAVLEAAQVLTKSAYLIVDCEGQNLGRTLGKLSIVTIATARAEKIYLIDVPALLAIGNSESFDPFQPISRILSSTEVRKLAWDGRMDSLELREVCHISLRGVLDLQLAEVMNARSGTNRSNTLRLARAFGVPMVEIKGSEKYKDFEAVVGMQRCLEESGLVTEANTGKDSFVVEMHKNNKTELWMERPINPVLLRYAAKDIRLIASLYERFSELGLLDSSNIGSLLTQSERYMSSSRRTDDSDIYRSKAVVPLDVLREPTGPKYPCEMCKSSLSISCFNSFGKRGKRMRYSRCRYCDIVAIKHKQSDGKWINV